MFRILIRLSAASRRSRQLSMFTSTIVDTMPTMLAGTLKTRRSGGYESRKSTGDNAVFFAMKRNSGRNKCLDSECKN
jgi:hypothetical protein